MELPVVEAINVLADEQGNAAAANAAVVSILSPGQEAEALIAQTIESHATSRIELPVAVRPNSQSRTYESSTSDISQMHVTVNAQQQGCHDRGAPETIEARISTAELLMNVSTSGTNQLSRTVSNARRDGSAVSLDSVSSHSTSGPAELAGHAASSSTSGMSQTSHSLGESAGRNHPQMQLSKPADACASGSSQVANSIQVYETPHLPHSATGANELTLDGVCAPIPSSLPLVEAIPCSPAPPSRCLVEGCTHVRRTGGDQPFCKTHGGGPRCSMAGCTRAAASAGFRPLCGQHGGGRRCVVEGCERMARTNKGNEVGKCAAHGGGKRCLWPQGCDKSARAGGPQFCAKHGGGQRCASPGCTKSAPEVNNPYCVSHGGGKRCQIADCRRSAASGGKDNLCIRHGGGRRCEGNGCHRAALSGGNLCATHGGISYRKKAASLQLRLSASPSLSITANTVHMRPSSSNDTSSESSHGKRAGKRNNQLIDGGGEASESPLCTTSLLAPSRQSTIEQGSMFASPNFPAEATAQAGKDAKPRVIGERLHSQRQQLAAVRAADLLDSALKPKKRPTSALAATKVNEIARSMMMSRHGSESDARTAPGALEGLVGPSSEPSSSARATDHESYTDDETTSPAITAQRCPTFGPILSSRSFVPWPTQASAPVAVDAGSPPIASVSAPAAPVAFSSTNRAAGTLTPRDTDPSASCEPATSASGQTCCADSLIPHSLASAQSPTGCTSPVDGTVVPLDAPPSDKVADAPPSDKVADAPPSDKVADGTLTTSSVSGKSSLMSVQSTTPAETSAPTKNPFASVETLAPLASDTATVSSPNHARGLSPTTCSDDDLDFDMLSIPGISSDGIHGQPCSLLPGGQTNHPRAGEDSVMASLTPRQASSAAHLPSTDPCKDADSSDANSPDWSSAWREATSLMVPLANQSGALPGHVLMMPVQLDCATMAAILRRRVALPMTLSTVRAMRREIREIVRLGRVHVHEGPDGPLLGVAEAATSGAITDRTIRRPFPQLSPSLVGTPLRETSSASTSVRNPQSGARCTASSVACAKGSCPSTDSWMHALPPQATTSPPRPLRRAQNFAPLRPSRPEHDEEMLATAVRLGIIPPNSPSRSRTHPISTKEALLMPSRKHRRCAVGPVRQHVNETFSSAGWGEGLGGEWGIEEGGLVTSRTRLDETDSLSQWRPTRWQEHLVGCRVRASHHSTGQLIMGKIIEWRVSDRDPTVFVIAFVNGSVEMASLPHPAVELINEEGKVVSWDRFLNASDELEWATTRTPSLDVDVPPVLPSSCE